MPVLYINFVAREALFSSQKAHNFACLLVVCLQLQTLYAKC